MKKLLILLFSLLISFNSYGLFHKTVCVETDSQLRDGVIYLPNKTKPFSGKNLCKYENGQNKSKGNIKDGKKNQLWTEWEENGQIKLERRYNFNQILREKNYQNGVEMNDTSFSFNENGQKEADRHYKDGKLVSETKYLYYDSGQKKQQTNFIDGIQYGKVTAWFENGLISSKGFFKGPKLVNETRYSYYEKGQIEEEVNYKDGKLDGKYSEWFENGQKKRDGNFKDNKADGNWTWWFENGQKSEEGNYKDDEKDGKTTRWQDGKVSVSYYKDGECISGC